MSKIDIFEENNIIPSISLDYSNINKSALGLVSGAVVDKVVSGDEDALETYIKVKAISEITSGILSDIKGLALDEASKYNQEEAKMLGCSFVVKSAATSYSFDHDEEWKKINEEIAVLKTLQKEREKKMVDAMNYAEIIDDKTGEVIPPAIVKKHGASVLAVTIPRE